MSITSKIGSLQMEYTHQTCPTQPQEEHLKTNIILLIHIYRLNRIIYAGYDETAQQSHDLLETYKHPIVIKAAIPETRYTGYRYPDKQGYGSAVYPPVLSVHPHTWQWQKFRESPFV